MCNKTAARTLYIIWWHQQGETTTTTTPTINTRINKIKLTIYTRTSVYMYELWSSKDLVHYLYGNFVVTFHDHHYHYYIIVIIFVQSRHSDSIPTRKSLFDITLSSTPHKRHAVHQFMYVNKCDVMMSNICRTLKKSYCTILNTFTSIPIY